MKRLLVFLVAFLWFGAVALAASGPCYVQDTTGCSLAGPLGAPNLGFNVAAPPYNAKCDGVTNDTAAIQSAVNAAQASGHNFRLVFPAGVCLTTAAITINSTGQNITITGQGRASSVIMVSGATDGIDVTINPVGGIFNGNLDISDLMLLASGNAQTALNLTSLFPNAVGPFLHQVRIGYSGTGSFANGITMALMSNIVAEDVMVESQNTTGLGIQFDGNATFPSINDKFTDVYFHNFAAGIQVGSGTSSYTQGVEIENAVFVGSSKCVLWHGSTGSPGTFADMLLMSNTHCAPSGAIGLDASGVANVILGNNYFLAGAAAGAAQTLIDIQNQQSCNLHGNDIWANGLASITGILVGPNSGGTSSGDGRCLIAGNEFFYYPATSQPIEFAASTEGNSAVDNRCDNCAASVALVIDNGSNLQRDNVNIAAIFGGGIDNISREITGEQTWLWQVPASPTLRLEGLTFGWDYAAGNGEADLFVSRGTGAAGGQALNVYDTSTGSVGARLMSLSAAGILTISGLTLPTPPTGTASTYACFTAAGVLISSPTPC